MEGAIRPEAPTMGVSNIVDADSEEILSPAMAQAKAREVEIAKLVDHPGWTHFKKELEREIADMRLMKTADVEGKSMEEIGKMFLVSSLAADKVEQALMRVDTIARQVEANNEVVE
jgi:hypothetical protein